MSELDFMEGCYVEAPDEVGWGMRLAEHAARIVPDAQSVIAATYRVDATGLRFLRIAGDARFLESAHAANARGCMENVNQSPQRNTLLARAYGGDEPRLMLLSDMPRDLCAPIRAALPWCDGDCVGFYGTFARDHGYFISPTKQGSWRLTGRRRSQLVRLSEHLAAGYWLRSLRATEPRALESEAVAVCAPDGRVLHHEVARAPELSARLVDAVRGMDRARCRRKKRSPAEATELWQALIAGHYTLVESFERNGRRLILALRCRAPRPALTDREAAVASAAARGAANKAIASELGLATSTVGVHLSAAMRKLGCPGRRVLPQWLAHAPTVRAD